RSPCWISRARRRSSSRLRNKSSAVLRSMNWLIWLPRLFIVLRSSSSDCRIVRLKNSRTPRNSPPLRTGNAHAPCKPVLWAAQDREVGAGVLARKAVVETLEELPEFGLEFAELRHVHARPSVSGRGEHTSTMARGSRRINLA